MTGSWKGRGNQYIQFVRVLYCKLPTKGKQLPAFSLEAVLGIEPRPQRWEAKVLQLCHRGPLDPSVYCCGFQVHLGELYLALPGSLGRVLPGSRYRSPSGSLYLRAPGPLFRVPGAVIVYQKRVSWGSGLLLGYRLKIPI